METNDVVAGSIGGDDTGAMTIDDSAKWNTHIGVLPITATVEEFCKLSGIGRSTAYKLLAHHDLESVKIGRRRLIIIDSYFRLIVRQQAAEAAEDNENNAETSSA